MVFELKTCFSSGRVLSKSSNISFFLMCLLVFRQDNKLSPQYLKL